MDAGERIEFDIARVRDTTSGCGWTLSELVAFYEPRARREIDAMRAALTEDDRETLARLAHGSAGSSATIGLVSLSVLHRQLMEQAPREPVDRLSDLLDRIERHLARVLVRLGELPRDRR